MNKLEVGFELDKQLAADSLVLGDFPLCQLLLINDKQYPWFVLVPRRAGVSELYHLSDEDRVQMMVESCDLSAALADGFAAQKMNVAAIGNIVNQLHVHHVVRFEDDASWPAPIWGKLPAKAYEQAEIETISKKVKSLLETTLLTHNV